MTEPTESENCYLRLGYWIGLATGVIGTHIGLYIASRFFL